MKLNHKAIPYIFDVPAYHVKRRLTILIAQPWCELSEEARTTLYKLIQALNIPGQGVPVIKRTALKTNEIQVLNTTFIISFEVPLNGYPDKYHLYRIADTTFVLADNLNTFCGDKSLKQKLWQLLQHKFRPA